jgi:hypothetical protein
MSNSIAIVLPGGFKHFFVRRNTAKSIDHVVVIELSTLRAIFNLTYGAVTTERNVTMGECASMSGRVV